MATSDVPSRPPLGTRAAEALVFFTSASVLVLEILAMRLVAPYVGISLETSTAVIGIALTAIAIGTWWGGRVADLIEPERLIGPLVLVGGACVLLVLPLVRWAGELLRGDSAGAVLTLAALAIFVPAALLSAVSPMIVKLQLATLAETGTVVGRLSAIGTAGAIVATFVTGFLLVAAAPTSAVLLADGVLLVLVGAALVLRQRRRKAAGVVLASTAAILLVGATGAVVAPERCDTETTYHCARVEVDPERPTGRILRLDTLRHSYVDLEDPTYLEFAYTEAIASVLDAGWPAGEPVRALHLGGGGLTVPRYLEAVRPGSESLVFEIDGGVIDLDRERLELRTGPRLRVEVGDARIGVQAQPDAAWDVVVGDAFGGLSVPWHLTTVELVQEVRRVLTDDGIYVVNIIDYGDLGFLRAELRTIAEVFPNLAVVAAEDNFGGGDGGNFVVVAAGRELPTTEIERLAQRRDEELTVLAGRGRVLNFAGPGRLLSDDWAPVDQLLGGG